MKTVKFLILTGLLLTAGFLKSYAGENEVKSQAFAQLDAQIQKTLQTFPFEEINSDDYSLMTVIFTVNSNHEMENIRVTGTDEYLTRYVEKSLQQLKAQVNPYFDGKTCRVPIRFIDARR